MKTTRKPSKKGITAARSDVISDDLTLKQRLFVEAFTGDATAAAIKVGYSPKTATEQGSRLLRNVKVKKAIKAREKKEVRPLIATRQKRQEFWTTVMENSWNKLTDRLKASELLGKSEGDFLERIEHSGGVARWTTPDEAAGAIRKRLALNKEKYEVQ